MLVGRWRWLVVGVAVVAVAALVAVRLDDRGEEGPEAVLVAVGAEGILCAETRAVPAEASSEGLQRGPDPEFVEDSRCDDLAAAPGPGEVALPRHSEADDRVGNVVLGGELRFDALQRCFYVVADDEPVGVVWPARFNGKVDPPRITDEDRSTVVAVGDRLELRGRYVSSAGDDCGPVDATSNGFIASSDIVLVTG